MNSAEDFLRINGYPWIRLLDKMVLLRRNLEAELSPLLAKLVEHVKALYSETKWNQAVAERGDKAWRYYRGIIAKKKTAGRLTSKTGSSKNALSSGSKGKATTNSALSRNLLGVFSH